MSLFTNNLPLPIVLVALSLSLVESASTATLCVAPSASGRADGSDWSNGMTFPSTLVRGNTYYLASGTYGRHVFNDVESGTNIITILKATESAHGPAAGWETSFGATNALLPAPSFTRSFYTIDGVTGSGRTGYGFQFVGHTVIGDATRPGLVGNLTFRHINCHYFPATDGVDEKNAWNPAQYGHLFKIVSGGSNFVFQSSYLHRVFGCPWQWRGVDTVLIDHCVVEKNKSSAEWHSEMISDDGSDNVTIKNNEFKDIEGTAFIALIASSPATGDNWNIYNNIFWHSGTWNASVASVISVIFDANNYSTATNWRIVHNTFASLAQIGSIYMLSPSGSNIVVLNNLFWQNRTNNAFVNYINILMLGTNNQRDYNYYSAAASPWAFTPASREPPYSAGPNCPLWPIPVQSIFVDGALGNFHLLRSLTDWRGISMDAPFNVDRDGNTRRNWDRGAYEFLREGGANLPETPTRFRRVFE